MTEHSATIVLVHGGFVDGAGWEGVYNILKKDGFDVSIVQNPTTTLADDVAATKQIISQAKGPVVLVGYSYGGVVITEAGNDPKVSKLVYITAFAADKGESVASLIKDPVHPCHRSCRHGMVSSSSTGRNSRTHLLLTLAQRKRHSWPTRKCLGA
jgi:pimeloyl-ACP methyl ester carboxylesterase